jgi:hypothetical protein
MTKPARKPGENFSFKTKKTEHQAIMEWLNIQDNITDSLRYLIEREILSNGVRNLQEHIPSKRKFDVGQPVVTNIEYTQIPQAGQGKAPLHSFEMPQKATPFVGKAYDDKPILLNTSKAIAEDFVMTDGETGGLYDFRPTEKPPIKKKKATKDIIDSWS